MIKAIIVSYGYVGNEMYEYRRFLESDIPCVIIWS